MLRVRGSVDSIPRVSRQDLGIKLEQERTGSRDGVDRTKDKGPLEREQELRAKENKSFSQEMGKTGLWAKSGQSRKERVCLHMRFPQSTPLFKGKMNDGNSVDLNYKDSGVN